MWGRAIVLLVLALSGCSVTSDLNDLKGGVAMDAGTQHDAAEESALSCTPGGSACQSTAGCCSGVCLADDTCASCKPEGSTCGADSECCAGLGQACSNGVCSGCLPVQASCKLGSDCCSGVCGLDQCRACGAPGDACDLATPCCSGSVCNGGVCTTSACEKCMTASCQTELDHCDSVPECAAIRQCQNDCANTGRDPQSCLQQCFAAHPDGTDAFNELLACVLSSCLSICGQP